MSTLTIGAISFKLLEDILEGAERLMPPHTLRSETTHTGTDEGTQISIVAVNGEVAEIMHLITTGGHEESKEIELFTLKKTPSDEWTLLCSSGLVPPGGLSERLVYDTVATFEEKEIFFPSEVFAAQHMTLGTLQMMKICLQSVASN